MVKKSELLVCLLLTTFMVTVKGNTNSTSANKTSNDASINYPSTLIPLKASTIGKAIFPKLELKRERDVGQEGETDDPTEEENKSSESPDEGDNQREDPTNVTSSAIADASSTPPDSPSNSTGLPTDETDTAETSEGTNSDHTDDTTPNETEEPSSTKDPGAKEGSAVCFKPALVYFLLLPLCITTKVRLLW